MYARRKLYTKKAASRRRTYKRRPATGARRPYRRRYYRKPYGIIPSLARTMNTFPERMTMKQKLCYWSEQDIPGGAMVPLIIAQNSVYQSVLVSGTGWSIHKPMYTDQMVSLYEKYRVNGMKYTIKVFSEQSSSETWYAGVMHSDSSTLEVDFLATRERGQGVWRSARSGPGGKPSVTLSGYMSPAVVCGQTKKHNSLNPEYSATYPGIPAKLAYLHLYYYPTGPGGVSERIHVQIDITYYVTWFDRKDVMASN